MKILVAGSSGFLGEYIVRELIKNNYKVYGIDIIENKNNEISFKNCNLNDRNKLKQIFEEFKPNFVYNLSALSDIDQCIEDPLTCIHSNILGNANLLDMSTRFKVQKFIFASSIYASGNHGGFYATSKKSAELIIKNYNQFYNLNYTILRYGTLFGLNAPQTNSITKYTSQALIHGKIDYTGDGSEIREYIHIKDAAKLSLKVLDEEFNNKTISIIGNHRIKTEELFSLINSILGSTIKINYNEPISRGRSNSHYKISPTSFDREEIYNLTTSFNRDLADAIVEILKGIQNENKKK